MTLQEFTKKYIDRKKKYDAAYSDLSERTKEYVGTAHLLMNDLFSDLISDLKKLNGETVKQNEFCPKCFNTGNVTFFTIDGSIAGSYLCDCGQNE